LADVIIGLFRADVTSLTFAGFKVCDLEEECFQDFEFVDAGFEDVVFEDRVQPNGGGASSKRPSWSPIVNSIWSSIKGRQLLDIFCQTEIIIFSL
jgi:hypothetical protein